MKPAEAQILKILDQVRHDKKQVDKIFHEAVRKGWLDVLRSVVPLGITKDSLSRALKDSSAFGADKESVVEILLNAGTDPTAKNMVANCGVRSLRLLLAAGGDIDGNLREYNPLLVAIQSRSNEDKALSLIEAGANVNVNDEFGRTPLMVAAKYGRSHVFNALLKAGADTTAVDSLGKSVVRHGAETLAHGNAMAPSYFPRVRAMLKKLKDFLPGQPEDIVLLDIVLGDHEALENRLIEGLDPNTLIRGSIGLLGMAWSTFISRLQDQFDKESFAAFLNPDLIPDDQELEEMAEVSSLLMWAISAKQPKAVMVLLEHGADVNWKNKDGVTIADLADHIGDRRILQILEKVLSNRSGKKSKDLNYSTAGSLSEKFDLVEDDVVKSLDHGVGLLEHLRQKKKDDIDFEGIPEKAWEVVSLNWVLGKIEVISGVLRQVLAWTNKSLFGIWRQNPDPHSRMSQPYEKTWRRKAEWIKSFSCGCAAAAILNEWDYLHKFCHYPDRDCYCGERSPMYNMEWFDWPFWIVFARGLHGESHTATYRKAIVNEKGRNPKLLLKIFDAINENSTKLFHRCFRPVHYLPSIPNFESQHSSSRRGYLVT